MMRFHNLDALIGAIGAVSAFQLGCTMGYEDTATDDAAARQGEFARGGDVDKEDKPIGTSEEPLVAAVPSLVFSGYFNIHNANSGKCLAIGGGSKNDGDVAIQFTCLSIPDQSWLLLNTAGNYYNIINANSGKCLAIGGGSKNDGDVAIQFTCLGIPDQSWLVISAGGVNYNIINANSGKCLSIGGGSKNDGDVAIQFTCLGVSDQKWYF